jgi:hypothetical protein
MQKAQNSALVMIVVGVFVVAAVVPGAQDHEQVFSTSGLP